MAENKVIMIIDDDPDDKDIFIEVLKEVDPQCKCILGKDGRDGINKLLAAEILPSFIFLDLNMPRMNGKQCLAEIKQIEKFKDIPVIIYSTSKLESEINETKNLGASYYLTKPSLFSELKEAMTDILNGEIKNKNNNLLVL